MDNEKISAVGLNDPDAAPASDETTPAGNNPQRSLASRAWDRSQRTGENLADARRAIELDEIRDGKRKPRGVISRLAAALRGEAKALELMDEAGKARAEAMALQKRWEGLTLRYRHLAGREALARAWVAALKTAIEGQEAFLAQNIGSNNLLPTYQHFLKLVQDLASAAAGIPFAERALEAVRAELRAHVATMREWGAKNGVPKETLASLGE